MIKTIQGTQESLNKYSTADWVKSAELGQTSHLPGTSQTNAAPKSFGDFLKESVEKVNELQTEANVAMEKLSAGKSENIHETLLAVEQADIAFRSMNQIRMKVIDAYKEIMKMQV